MTLYLDSILEDYFSSCRSLKYTPFDSIPVLIAQNTLCTPRNETAKTKKPKSLQKNPKSSKHYQHLSNLWDHWSKKSVCNAATTMDQEAVSGNSKREWDGVRSVWKSSSYHLQQSLQDRSPSSSWKRNSNAWFLLSINSEHFLHGVKRDY